MKSLRKPPLPVSLNSYDEIAGEYYDANRHPTCSNFNFLSRAYLAAATHDVDMAGVVEVGAGMSSMAPILQSRGISLRRLLITDASAAMLAYSRDWEHSGARLKVAPADDLPVLNDSAALLVAGLADPYNTQAFWCEATRIVAPGGLVIVTLPSFEWAIRYRRHHSPETVETAEFELRNGARIRVPSLIYSLSSQIKLIHASGLSVVEFRTLSVQALGDQHRSPKLEVFERGFSSLVWGFIARKPERFKPAAAA